MTETWVAALIPAILLGSLALWIRFHSKSWLAPGAFFALYWSIIVSTCLFAAPNYTVLPGGVWWILASVLAVYAGNLLATNGRIIPLKLGTVASRVYFSVRATRYLLLCSILLGLAGPLITMKAFGYHLKILFSLQALVRMGHELAVARYTGVYDPPLATQLALVFVYSAPLLGGLLFAFGSSKLDKGVGILAFIPSIVNSLIHAAFAGVFLSAALWLAAYFTGLVLLNRGRVTLFCRSHLLMGTAFGLLVFLAYFFTRVIRYQALTGERIAIIFNRLQPQLFGHIAAFTRWFHESWYNSTSPSFGAYTLAGLFDFLGLHERVLGLYPEPTTVGPGATTNIYTIFRGLIQDFTLPGSLVILFILGALAGRAYYRLAQSKFRPIWLIILMGFYVSTIYGYIVCPFCYNSVVMVFLVMLIYLYITRGCGALCRLRGIHPVSGLAHGGKISKWQPFVEGG